MKQKTLAMIVVLALSLTGCQREANTGPYEISGRIFVFNYRLSYATYLVTLKRLGTLDTNARMVARFENPAGGEMLETSQKLFPAQEKVVIESPHLTCVRKDRPYAVAIRILSDDGTLLQELQTMVKSDLDQSILPPKPLVDGPAYQRNAAAFDENGKPLTGTMEGCPPG